MVEIFLRYISERVWECIWECIWGFLGMYLGVSGESFEYCGYCRCIMGISFNCGGIMGIVVGSLVYIRLAKK
jgi:hypothetical protein